MSSSKKITCYGPTGNQYKNNTQCPDSDSCCQTAEQCRPDRLCNANKDVDQIVRAGCKYYPWSDNCAKVCVDEDSWPYLPRVNICNDGSYCCVKDVTCCVDKRGFFLNDDGSIKARANETTLETSSTTIASRTSSTESSKADPTKGPAFPSSSISSSAFPGALPGSAPNENPETTSSSGVPQGVKYGVGFGVTFGVLFLALIAFFIWRSRQKRNRLQMNPAAYPTYGQTKKMGEKPVELPVSQATPRSELGDESPIYRR
ncbi:hypothetical protein AJ79_00664 [Helicocarpus griseus UAMH5409]|uniref:Mid2 domain-containing protein n=1 Tax=Helicocarpus griseus UAMH5409 TaxID=1447875 RepID=A0A2B7YAU2_9EURO|nr:hypothetical protein AJ79_00664 [Helicocarpus griseus UAMH5409]